MGRRGRGGSSPRRTGRRRVCRRRPRRRGTSPARAAPLRSARPMRSPGETVKEPRPLVPCICCFCGASGIPVPCVHMTVEREGRRRCGKDPVEVVPALLRHAARSRVVHLVQQLQPLQPVGSQGGKGPAGERFQGPGRHATPAGVRRVQYPTSAEGRPGTTPLRTAPPANRPRSVPGCASRTAKPNRTPASRPRSWACTHRAASASSSTTELVQWRSTGSRYTSTSAAVFTPPPARRPGPGCRAAWRG